jgi:predicted TIM-barrel fold metal-dependent hydrolase
MTPAAARIISADDHMDLNVLPPDLFTARVAPAFREEAPRVVETDDGPFWVAEGRRLRPSGQKPAGMISAGGDRGLRPGVPALRLEDLDADGVYASVIYGPVGPDFVQDRALRAACLRAYNDWAAEFTRESPERLVTLAMLPSHDPGEAEAELRRVAGMGLRGAIVEFFEAETPPFETPWEGFWAAADETRLPVHFHLSGGTHSITFSPRSWRQPASVTVAPLQLDEALVGTIFAGVFHRHPDVKLVLGEAGLGWIPYIVERMDHEWHKYGDRVEDVRLPEPPSHYFRQNVLVTYEEDDLGLELLTGMGMSNAMWASDYPHGDSTWPNSRKAIAGSALRTLDPATRDKITSSNAAALYGIT